MLGASNGNSRRQERKVGFFPLIFGSTTNRGAKKSSGCAFLTLICYSQGKNIHYSPHSSPDLLFCCVWWEWVPFILGVCVPCVNLDSRCWKDQLAEMLITNKKMREAPRRKGADVGTWQWMLGCWTGQILRFVPHRREVQPKTCLHLQTSLPSSFQSHSQS